MDAGHPVVALETTILTHGMPHPQNIETALEVEGVVRNQGAVPASIGLLDGTVHVGQSYTPTLTMALMGHSALMGVTTLHLCIDEVINLHPCINGGSLSCTPALMRGHYPAPLH